VAHADPRRLAPQHRRDDGAHARWSAERAREEFQSYDASLWEEEALLQRHGEER